MSFKPVIVISAILSVFAPHVCAVETDAIVVPDSSSMVNLREIEVSVFKRNIAVGEPATATTTIDRAEVERYNIVSMKGISEITPNFYMPAYGSRMTSSIYVRGLGTRIDQPVVGLNVDNVPIMNKDNYDFDLVDIDHIEMLRGPQSTLFGRNTMGGVINIKTLSPMLYRGVRLLAEYGRGNSLRAAASVYTRPSQTLGMAVSGYYTATDGFFRNNYTGNKIDSERQGSVRWKTSWRPTARVSVDNAFSGTLSRQGGYPYASLESGVVAHNDTCFYRRNSLTDALSVVWSGSRVSVASSTAVQYIDDNMTLDQDFLPDDYFTLTQRRKEWILTEDFIVKGSVGDYNWLGGLFAFWRTMRMDAPVTFKADGIDKLILGHRNEMNPDYPALWRDDSFVLDSRFSMPGFGVALYHDSRIRVGDFMFDAGVRVDYERVALRYRTHASTGYDTYHRLPDGTLEFYGAHPLEVGGTGRIHRSFIQVLPKVSVSWQIPALPGSNVYASVSKGYKAGGYNTQMFSTVLQQELMSKMGMSAPYDVDEVVSYRPEKSWNYEVGAHVSVFDSKLDMEAAAFFIDCRDQQLTVFPDGNTTGRMMTNAGRTNSYGVELSLAARPIETLLLNATWGYTHATFRRFDNGMGNFAGKRLPYAPANTLFVGATYTLSFATATPTSLQFVAGLRGVGDIYWNEENTVKQPFYALLDASVELTRGIWALKLWGENITARNYDTFYFVSVGNAFVQRGTPWRVGATLRVAFDL